MIGFVPRVRRALDQLPVALVLVPVLFSLLNTDAIQAVLRFETVYVGVTATVPTAVLDLWSVVNVPQPTGSTPPAGSTSRYVEPAISVTALRSLQLPGLPGLFWFLLVFPVAATFRAVLTAGYLGSLQEYRQRGAYSFGSNLTAYFRPFFLLELATGITLIAGSVLLDAIALPFLSIPLSLVGAYLFYGAPFLFVIEDCNFVEGLRRSYTLALESRTYFLWGISYFAVVLSSSVVLAVVVNFGTGVYGLLLGGTVVSVFGVALTMASLSFFDDVVVEGRTLDDRITPEPLDTGSDESV
jgi:hypothetical protein